MSDKTYDVVIAGYAAINTARGDFDALAKLAGDKKIKTTEGVILVQHDADDSVHVTNAADQYGRKGMKAGAVAGVVVGLFSPPLLASIVIGGAAGGIIGKFTKHRIDNQIEKNVGEAIPKGSAGIITLVETVDIPAVKGALKGSAMTKVVSVDGDGIRALKEGLTEAAEGAKSGS